jgi:hypothetical protein
MALNFPDPATQTPVNTWSPTSTPSATTNGTTYTWDGEKWRVSGSPAFVNISGDTMTGDLTVPSLNEGPLAGYRNALINGGMVVNQRLNNGAAPTSKWITDRWANDSFAQISSARTLLVPIPKGSTRAIELTLNGTAGVLTQPVEVDGAFNGQFEIGSTWTLSWWTTNINPQCNCYWFDSNGVVSLVAWTKVGGVQTLETDSGYTRLAQTFTVTARTNPGHTQLNVEFGTSGASGTVALTNAQLEPGPVATLFEHRPIATELALCQRYFQTISGIDLLPEARNGTVLIGTSIRAVVMRKSPNETLTGPNNNVSGPFVTGNEYRWAAKGTQVNDAAGASTGVITSDAEL